MGSPYFSAPVTKVLVTGGAGYIGGTIASACLDEGIVPVILDDLSTGCAAFTSDRLFYRGDIADRDLIARILAEHPEIAVVVHCAAGVVVPESVTDPLGYYRNNVAKTIDMLTALADTGCRNVVFSSSASIYAPAERLWVDENSAMRPSSPYARTKLMVEQILADNAAAGTLRAISLRYFNPIGADRQLRTGSPNPDPTHVLAVIIRAGRSGEPFPLTGTDWPTRDGSGIRDYVHVWDLARAHVAAVRRFDDITRQTGGYVALDLGTGRGTTVRELVAAYEQVTGRTVRIHELPRRPGDVAGGYTRSTRAAELLGWRPELPLEAGIRDALRWAEVSASARTVSGGTDGAPGS